MSKNRYSNYKAEDFAADSYFQKWVVQEDELAAYFWKRWLKANPYKEEEINQAAGIIKGIKFKKYEATNEDFMEVWNNILVQQAVNHYNKRSIGSSFWPSLAAACIALLCIVGIVYFNHENKIIHSTGFNETATITLPDSSTVILNSNSTISYNSDWKNDRHDRIVYLKGEAFFSVRHTIEGEKFQVFANDVKIEVLGTEFAVKYRRGKARIILQSGKVKLEVPKANTTLWQSDESHTEEIFMEPGDLIEYSEEYQGLMKKEVVPEKYSAWTRNILIFENNSLAEVGNYIEDNYGYEVKFEEEAIEKMMFSGKINDKRNLDLLINILQETFNLNVYKNEAEIIIKRK